MSSPSSTNPSVSTSDDKSPAPSRGNFIASSAVGRLVQIDTHIFAAGDLLLVGERGADRHRNERLLDGARQRQNRRPHHIDKGDKTRHQISRQSDERRATDNAHG